jgi:hypothetical protein
MDVFAEAIDISRDTVIIFTKAQAYAKSHPNRPPKIIETGHPVARKPAA